MQQPGARSSPGPPPPADERSAAEPAQRAAHSTCLAPADPLREKPQDSARTPSSRREREEAWGLTGAWLSPQTYPALRAPLPPLEDAPPPPPGRAGRGREERGEGAEIGSAPAAAPALRRPGLGSPRCAGTARSLGRPIADRLPPAARPLALPGARRRRSLF